MAQPVAATPSVTSPTAGASAPSSPAAARSTTVTSPTSHTAAAASSSASQQAQTAQQTQQTQQPVVQRSPIRPFRSQVASILVDLLLIESVGVAHRVLGANAVRAAAAESGAASRGEDLLDFDPLSTPGGRAKAGQGEGAAEGDADARVRRVLANQKALAEAGCASADVRTVLVDGVRRMVLASTHDAPSVDAEPADDSIAPSAAADPAAATEAGADSAAAGTNAVKAVGREDATKRRERLLTRRRDARAKMAHWLESIGYRVGYGLAERLGTQTTSVPAVSLPSSYHAAHPSTSAGGGGLGASLAASGAGASLPPSNSGAEPATALPHLLSSELDAVKFLCREVWLACFGRQVDNLKTNHRGVYVLSDSAYRPLKSASRPAGLLPAHLTYTPPQLAPAPSRANANTNANANANANVSGGERKVSNDPLGATATSPPTASSGTTSKPPFTANASGGAVPSAGAGAVPGGQAAGMTESEVRAWQLRKLGWPFLHFPRGLARGVLANLGYVAAVTAESPDGPPSLALQVKITGRVRRDQDD